MRTFDEIRELATNLQRRRAYILRYMLEIKRHYEADWVVIHPDVKDEPESAQMIPQLITDTVDSLAMRASSVQPTITVPAKNPGQLRSNERAMARRRILSATYHENSWKIKSRRKYRHEAAYGTSGIWVMPDFFNERITMKVRDPLMTFPEPTAPDDVEAPEYVAFITRYSGSHLRTTYPVLREEMGGPIAAVCDDKEWDIVEWIDSDQIVFGLLGPVEYEGDHVAASFIDRFNHGPWMQIGPAIKNRANVCLAVTPQEVSLHSIGNRLNGLLGNIQMQSLLMAMEVQAQQKAVFPDTYVIGNPNETPRILNGQWVDGRTGDVNLLSGVAQVGQMSQTPDVRTQAMIDRLERNTRVSAGLNPQFGGESYGSLRTGRALDAMMASSVDPRIQEMHEVTEAWMPKVNRAILAAYEGWFGDKKFTLFSGWPGDKGLIEFTPSTDIEGIHHTAVNYAIPGADVVQVTQVLGSMLGAGALSLETFRRIHPWIEDAADEHSQITEEEIFKAIIAGVQQQIASGQLPMSILAQLHKMMQEGKSLTDAMLEIDNIIREQQAQAQAEAMQAQQPMDPMSQMGLAAGPAAAAPLAPPPGVSGNPPQPLAPGGPEAEMQAVLQAALAGGG